MKAILDSWLKVQAAWLYLEPIFGSQDIRRQIPVEGQMFEEVDEHWYETNTFWFSPTAIFSNIWPLYCRAQQKGFLALQCRIFPFKLYST